MCLKVHTFFFLLFLKFLLRSVSDQQFPLWLQHPKSITTGINRRHQSARVTQLQVVVSQQYVNEPEEEP